MSDAQPTRRSFVKSTASAAMVTAMAAGFSRSAHAGGSGTIRVGLVGCGGRGVGAAANALAADSGTKLIAMADLFEDMAVGRLRALQGQKEIASQVDVTPERIHIGFDGYKHVIDQVDVVLLATSPHYRPVHLKYAVEKGIHAFVEKPVATDPVMLRDMYETCEKAKEKNLTIVSGLCYRYENAKIETVQQIHDGMIGDLVSAETYYLTGPLWDRSNIPTKSPMEAQNRNWYYHTWLSGDFIAEQHVHSLDKIAWVLGQYPIAAISLGGRQQRTEERFGNIYDHFATVFEYEGGLKAYSYCRQMGSVYNSVNDYIYGTNGMADIQGHRIRNRDGKIMWSHARDGKFQGREDMYQNEHNEMFKALREGRTINNGEYMCKSTMMALIGREAAYTGQRIDWDQFWNSSLSLAPSAYEWGLAPEHPVPIPGQYKLPRA